MTDSIIQHLLENKKHTANHRNSKKTTTFVFNKCSVTYLRKCPIIQHLVSDSGHSQKRLKESGTTHICKAMKYTDLHLSPHSVYLSKQRLYRLKWTVTDNQWCKYAASRNRFRNRKQLARKGMENSSEVVVFYRAPRVPRSDFNHRRVFDTLRSKMDTMQGIIASYGQKKRSIYRQNRPFNWPWSVLYSTEFLLTRTIFWKRLKSIFHKKRSRCVKSVICD